jgi:hypothetical protein
MSGLDDVPMLSERSYEELAVGDRWGPFAERLEPALCDALRGPVGADAGPAHGAVTAPLGVLPLLTLRGLRRALAGIIPGGVLVRQSFSTFSPLPARGDVTVDAVVTDRRRRGNGLHTTFAFTLRADGRTAAVVEWTILAPR